MNFNKGIFMVKITRSNEMCYILCRMTSFTLINNKSTNHKKSLNRSNYDKRNLCNTAKQDHGVTGDSLLKQNISAVSSKNISSLIQKVATSRITYRHFLYSLLNNLKVRLNSTYLRLRNCFEVDINFKLFCTFVLWATP